MYTKILVPLDGSERAERILPHAETLAQKFGGQLVLLQVVEPIISTVEVGGMVPYYNAEAMLNGWLAEARIYLADVKDKLNTRGIEAKTVAENGPVVFSILQVAQRENVDLITLASHGRTGLSRVFMEVSLLAS